MADIMLGMKDDGATHEVAVGDHVHLSLPENPTTGFRWELPPFKEGTLNLVSHDGFDVSSSAADTGGTRHFVFEAVAPGREVLKLKNRRHWEPEGEHAAAYEVTLSIKAGAKD